MKSKTEKNILIAFILNLSFSVFELFGGVFTGSVAILSDSVHDIGDAAGIGISWFLEKKSRKNADENYTYGYSRFSVLGAYITNTILVIGSLTVAVNAVRRLIAPVDINYRGMIVFSVIGFVTNLAAAWFTREGDSLNQKSVNLHMLEDVLGWLVVLIGSVIMNFTDISRIDAVMSIGVSVFILINALRNLLGIGRLFLEKTPDGINIDELKHHLTEIDGVADVHHIHIRSTDGFLIYATMHIVLEPGYDAEKVKKEVREELSEHNIGHSVLETEITPCGEGAYCDIHPAVGTESHHHHHH